MKTLLSALIVLFGLSANAALYSPIFDSTQFGTSPVLGGSNVWVKAHASFTNINVNGVTMNWPTSNSGGALVNDGSGGLTWSTSGSFFGNQTANYVFSGPASGANAPPTFRPLVNADLPNIGTAGTYTKITVNAKGVVSAGTNAVLASTDFIGQGPANTVLHGNSPGSPQWLAVNLSLGADTFGTLATANGGTGTTTPGTQYGVTYYSTTTTMASTAAGTSFQVLVGTLGAAPSWGSVNEDRMSLSDLTTLNASTSKHGFLKKLSGVSTEFLDGSGSFSTPSFVSSVSLSMPSIFNVSPSTITSSGTFGVTLATQTANKVFASATSGGAATPAFRSLVNADLPASGVSANSYTKVTVNAQGIVTSGTSAILASSDFANQGASTNVLVGNASGNPSWQRVNLSTMVTNVLSVSNGGLGVGSGFVVGAPIWYQNPTFASTPDSGTTNKVLHGDAVTSNGPQFAPITEYDFSFTDITTANVSTTKHGLTPKLSNVATNYLSGDGSWGNPMSGFARLGTGTANRIAKFSASDTIANSLLFDNGTIVSNSVSFLGPSDTPAYSFTAASTVGLQYSEFFQILQLVNGPTLISAWPSYIIGTVNNVASITIQDTQTTFPGRLVVDSGTSSAPSFTFSGDVNTGIFRQGADSLGITAGGTEQVRIGTGGAIRIRGVDYVFPSSLGAAGTFLQTDASGNLSWQTASGSGFITGSGTVNKVAKFTGGSAVGDSSMFDNGSITSNSLPHYLPQSSFPNPMVSFTAATNVGALYDSSVQYVYLVNSIGGANNFLYVGTNVAGIEVYDGTTANQFTINTGRVMQTASGSDSAPSWTWSNDLDTGMFRQAANKIGFAAGGTEEVRIGANGIELLNGVTYSWPTSQGAADSYLKNNGSGTLTWASIAGAGTVTQVDAASVTGLMTVSGVPFTTSGTITYTLDTQTANKVFASGTSGPAATPSFRALVTADVSNQMITYAKIQNVSATDRLLGRDSSGAGVIEELTVSGGIEFTGSGGIQSSAFTGDVTKTAGGTALTIANDAVTFAKFQNVSSGILLGRYSASSGDMQEITIGSGVSLSGAGVLSATGTGGTVTSVALTVPSFLSVSGSPITTSGTLAVTLATESANTGFFGPTTGAAAVPAFRAMVNADLPDSGASANSYTKVTVNVKGIVTSGTSAILESDFPNQGSSTHVVLHGNPGGNLAFSLLDLAADVTGVTPTANGGTGTSSAGTQYGVVYYSATTTMASTAAGANTDVLLSNSGSAPTFGPVTEARMSFSDVTTLNSSTSQHGFLKKLSGSSSQFMDGTGNWSTPAGAGTVTSVNADSVTGLMTVSGVPFTGSGTIHYALDSQTANKVFASPNGSSGSPSFRALVNADFPVSGVTASSYTKVTVNAQGIITSGTSATLASSDFNGQGLTTQTLHGGGVGGDPSWGLINLGNEVTGTLDVTEGGTGLNSLTTGDILYADATDHIARRAIGTSGYVLTVSGGLPVWAAPAASGVSSVTVNGLGGLATATGNPITGSGTITFGLDNQTAHTVLAGPVSGAATTPTFRLLTLAGSNSDFQNQGTSSQVLHGNASGGLTWAAVNLNTEVTGTLPLNSVGAAISSSSANHTIFTNQWRWTNSTAGAASFALKFGLSADNTGFLVSEDAKSTAGSAQYLAQFKTLANSTAYPLAVFTRETQNFLVSPNHLQVYVANNESAALPAYSFYGLQSAGLGYDGADYVILRRGTTSFAQFGASDATISSPGALNVTATSVKIPTATFPTPMLTFSGATTAGLLYDPSVQYVYLINAVGGLGANNFVYVGTNVIGLETYDGTTANQFTVTPAGVKQNATGNAGAPSYTWTSDTDTGMFRQAANKIGFSAAGTEKVRFGFSGIEQINGVSYAWTGTQGAANTYLKNDGSGNLTWATVTPPGVRAAFAGYSMATVTNANTGSLLPASFVGSKTLAGGTAVAGGVVKIELTGIIWAAGQTPTVEVYYGSDVIASTGATATWIVGENGTTWKMSVVITFYDTSTVWCDAQFTSQTTGILGFNSRLPVTVSTAASKDFDVKWTWPLPGYGIDAMHATIEYLNM